MFDNLSDKLGGIFDKLRGKGRLSEDDVNAAAREIRVALLEADVALPIVKDFIETVKEKAIGADVTKSVTPAQQVIKIVHDAMVDMLGGDIAEPLNIDAKPPVTILMVGLQGSGKTTSTAKISKFLKDKQNKKVLMASLDTYRPAAQDQLAVLGEQTGIDTLEIIKDQKPLEITDRALKKAKLEGYDILMLDTAGRLAIDQELMDEVAAISKKSNPAETLLVVDAMTGQDAVNTSKEFDEKVGITGIMMTRIDGDARGGAAMSMRGVTGKPIKLMGVGEQVDAIEPFYPDRIAGRILGMGDVVSLVEKAQENIAEEEAMEMAEKFKKGQFDFNDLLKQLRQMNKMGGAGALMKMMPGLGNMTKALEGNLDESILKKQEAIILSMTKQEREKPALMNASRKKRIAAGSGTDVPTINKLIKQQQQMQTMMKRIKKMGMGNMMKQMKGLMGGKADELEMMAQSMDPDALGKDMAGLGASEGPLGPNPFDNMPTGAGLPGLGGMRGAMPGMGADPFPTRGGTKKKRKPRPKKGKRK
ncbi:MAG: signal recognition particle protein [Pseudomonadota bacterium]